MKNILKYLITILIIFSAFTFSACDNELEKEEFSNLIYAKTDSSCILLGVKDKSITELTIPNSITEIEKTL